VQNVTRRPGPTEERHGEVRKEGAVEGQESHARTQGRHVAKRRFGQEGQEPEAGDCDRPVRSPARGSQGAAEEVRLEEVRLEEVRLEEVRLEEVGNEEVGLEEVGLEEVGLEEVGDEEVGNEEVDVEAIVGEEIVGQEIRPEEIGDKEEVREEIGEEEVGEEIGVVARSARAIGRGARVPRPSARIVCGADRRARPPLA
jgi:hypothetical protein